MYSKKTLYVFTIKYPTLDNEKRLRKFTNKGKKIIEVLYCYAPQANPRSPDLICGFVSLSNERSSQTLFSQICRGILEESPIFGTILGNILKITLT
jgi:hypothetical protein